MLGMLRNYRRTIVRIVMPAIALAWLGAAAAPCVAMTGVPEPAQHADGGAVVHDRAPHARGHPGHDGHAGTHGGCPHCPDAPGAGHEHRTDTHTSCSAAEDGSSQRERPAPLKLDLKHAPPLEEAAACEAGRTSVRLALSSPRRDLFADPPLNLTYCVFLN